MNPGCSVRVTQRVSAALEPALSPPRLTAAQPAAPKHGLPAEELSASAQPPLYDGRREVTLGVVAPASSMLPLALWPCRWVEYKAEVG